MCGANRRAKLAGVFFLLVFTLSVSAQQPIKPANWNSCKFLLGEWIGEGGGNVPGQGEGGSKFYFDLQDRILVRTNYSVFPATKDRLAFTHNDLMIIYQESGATRADYFDNEGHVIHYTAEFSKDQDILTFTSEIKPSEPRFRLTYLKEPGNKLRLKFEFAPPGKPEAFAMYIEAVMKKK
jgi:hypothetical protein